MAQDGNGVEINRTAITACVMLSTIMQALDTTIANVALPHIQGSVSASQDQITWVLTSYITAAAIMTPTTGFLAGRFGLKRLFLTSIAGFTVASMLCGMAQSLIQIVLFRLLQGMFGASLVPLSQSVLLNINSKERQGRAMGAWGVAVMVGPILGPILGGWLTQDYSWRYVFYINLPIGILAFLGISAFLPETSKNRAARLDWIGFGTLSLAIGALQVLLDRGNELDWFGSAEILMEAVIAGSALFLFVAHTFTGKGIVKTPFLRPALFRDRNFAAGTLFGAIIGLTYYASLALLPPYLQNLMNFPVVTAGIALGPQGLGTMASMIVVGRLVGKVDTRLLLATGLVIAAYALHEMTQWTPDVSEARVMGTVVVLGAGLGFLFVPLSVAALSTLPPSETTEGAGFYTLARNIASSAGISIVSSLLAENTQVNHALIGQHVTAVNRGFENPAVAQVWNPTIASGRAALNAMVTHQAQIIAYVDDFKLIMIAILAAIPLLIVFKRPARPAGREPVVVPE